MYVDGRMAGALVILEDADSIRAEARRSGIRASGG